MHGVGDAGGPRATPWCVAERSVGCGPRPSTPDGDSSCRPGTSVDVTTAVRTEPKTESDVIRRDRRTDAPDLEWFVHLSNPSRRGPQVEVRPR